jgi:hypothetical protein
MSFLADAFRVAVIFSHWYALCSGRIHWQVQWIGAVDTALRLPARCEKRPIGCNPFRGKTSADICRGSSLFFLLAIRGPFFLLTLNG